MIPFKTDTTPQSISSQSNIYFCGIEKGLMERVHGVGLYSINNVLFLVLNDYVTVLIL